MTGSFNSPYYGWGSASNRRMVPAASAIPPLKIVLYSAPACRFLNMSKYSLP